MNVPAPDTSGRLRAAGLLLGFALGGFFDGILLHQVLQWHHLLSGVDAAAVQDARVQLLADGLFHLLMYLLAAGGLYLLWRARARFAQPGADRVLWSRALVGFGSWHVVDAVVSHWLTGIHRIRGDAANPLLWDLLWLAAFGLVPLVAGLWLARQARGSEGGGGRTAAATLGLAALVAGPLAAWPAASDSPEVLVMFRPGHEGAGAWQALAALDARVLWVDGSGGLWAVRLDDPQRARTLYRHGALLVSNSMLPTGCLGWTRPAPPARPAA